MGTAFANWLSFPPLRFMSFEVLGSPWLAVLVALAPGLFYWWSARPLERAMDDPVLPERLLNLQRRTSAILISAIMVLFVLSGLTGPDRGGFLNLFWSLPLLVVVHHAAAYPLRRALYDETWSLATYLWFTVRTLIALPGFWLLLAAVPFVAGLAGRLDWFAGAAIGAVLLAWNMRYHEILRWLFSARPVRDEALMAQFTRMADACGLGNTQFEVVNLRGGAVLNAVALPSRRQPAVVFTDTMLRRLDFDEVVGICGHELAHLEYYNPTRLRQLAVRTTAMIAFGVVVAPFARMAGWSPLVVLTIWVMSWLAFVVTMARNRQKNETESDRRAVGLTGDPEALIRALTKAYAFNRFPRRLDAEFERHATHPSLAKRIRDIRAAANQAAPAVLNASLSITCVDGSVLMLDEARVSWTEPDGTTHSVPYEQVVELRFDVANRRGPQLVVVQKSGRKWHFVVNAADVARVQQTLDAIDSQLAEAAPTDQWMGLARILASVGAVISISVGSIGLALVAILAAFRPSARFLAAAGFAAIAGAITTLRDQPLEGELLIVVCLFLTALGAAWLYMAWTKSDPPPDRRDALAFLGLGVLATGTTLMLILSGSDALDMHQNAASMPGVTALIVAFSGALVFTPGRWNRPLAGLTALIAVAVTAIGTAEFLDRFGRDPFLLQSAPLHRQFVSGLPSAEFAVPFQVFELRVSPQGRHVALGTYNYEHGQGGMTYHVGRPGQSLSQVAGDDLVFLDDGHLLVMRSRMGSVELEVRDASSADTMIWSREIRNILGPHLIAHAGTGRWAIIGIEDRQQVVRVEGKVGTDEVREQRWGVSRAGIYPAAVIGSGQDVLVVETDFDFGLAEGEIFSPMLWLRLFRVDSPGVRWWRTGGSGSAELGSTRLGTTCSSAGAPENHLLCGAFDGKRTRFALIDGDSGQVIPVGWLSGRFLSFNRGTSTEWASGYCGSTATLVNASTRQTLELGADQDSAGLRAMVATDAVVAGAWIQQASTIIRLFRRPGDLSAQASPDPDSAAPRQSP
jgi:Zn-dependent protease with chaperone function